MAGRQRTMNLVLKLRVLVPVALANHTSPTANAGVAITAERHGSEHGLREDLGDETTQQMFQVATAGMPAGLADPGGENFRAGTG